MLTRYNNDGNLIAWVRPLDSDAMAELESAHCYAAEFGTVLEWCTMATDNLFTGTPSTSRNRRHAASFAESMHRAAVAYTQIRDARRVERVLGGEAA